jgi:hypothetical protein
VTAFCRAFFLGINAPSQSPKPSTPRIDGSGKLGPRGGPGLSIPSQVTVIVNVMESDVLFMSVIVIGRAPLVRRTKTPEVPVVLEGLVAGQRGPGVRAVELDRVVAGRFVPVGVHGLGEQAAERRAALDGGGRVGGPGEMRHRPGVKERGIEDHLARQRTPHGSGLGKIRSEVERSLAWVGQARRLKIRYANRLVPNLVELLKDTRRPVRKQAILALEQIDPKAAPPRLQFWSRFRHWLE